MTGDRNERAIWQVSAGPSDRSYADQFLKYGVALIGPGDAGPWSPDRSDDEFEDGFVRGFVAELRTGDVLLLRMGLSKIRAVGLVASEYPRIAIPWVFIGTRSRVLGMGLPL